MVSLHKALAESPATAVSAEFEAPSKKRKWEEPFAEEFFKDQSKEEKRKSIHGIELHLETPLASDKWQKCFSIQSGHIQLCNSRTNKKAEGDTWRSHEPPSKGHMSLDLELNLTCESLKKQEAGTYDINDKLNSIFPGKFGDHDLKDSSSLTRTPSWLSLEGDHNHKEMVATVCMRCHMLVMLCKSSPTCPNCKFMHPPDPNPSTFLKRRCSLWC
ncbi:hypothetical protein L6164_030584 [Bauhinia variegata]|uniref:Uncharacterized protein n=1 Tax=Bauhinia variegata TaxID=167791 RepID=A0ACB9LCT3_BAUVA|nr:hypothetical protein L6164_030584 [Bauhinia variegata]